MSPKSNSISNLGLIVVGLAVIAGVVAYATRDQWLPLATAATAAMEPNADEHAGHDHGSHDSSTSIELSARGLKNIGFEPFEVTPGTYQRKLKLPAIVVERPGRSQIHITAPLTGIVTAIHAVNGDAVDSGDVLFDIRLTHEELVSAQREFLESIAKLRVVRREIARLEGLPEGVIAGKQIIQQEYEKEKLEAALRSAEQAMLLHGLSEEQITEVRSTGELFRDITIRAPKHDHPDEACQGPHLLTVQKLGVARGEYVEMGRELAVLADHCELHIEALAFEDDAPALRAAAESNRKVTAALIGEDSPDGQLNELEILYVAGQIDAESRALKFYVRLPNQVALHKTLPSGRQVLEWKFKPGQRMQLRVPVETWENQLVLPVDAVVDEGAEAYVYQQNGDHFNQVPVHVLYRDRAGVVIANDGALFKGDVIAGRGAYQMHLALKNMSGGAADPHAGHHH